MPSLLVQTSREHAGNRRKRNKFLTVGSHAVGDGGWGQGVALLGVDELADRGQLVHAVHFAEWWRVGAIGGLRLHGSPANQGDVRTGITGAGC